MKEKLLIGSHGEFQCRTQHFMWCNCSHGSCRRDRFGFNAARSILCGATQESSYFRIPKVCSFNAARSILCGATSILLDVPVTFDRFQCRTQHFMWCNPSVEPAGVPEIVVSMPHAAFYVVQRFTNVTDFWKKAGFNAARSILCGATIMKNSITTYNEFQCRTQHFMWCNKVVVPA